MLQDKIKKYLESGNYEKFGLSTDDMAHDIAEICEKDFANRDCLGDCEPYKTIKKLEKENAELKQQINSLKYLDRQEVENIIKTLNVSWITGNTAIGEVERMSKDICSLAIKSIDKDKIVEVLRKYRYDNNKIADPNNFENIANEILL